MIDEKTLDWKKGDGLIPAIIQDAATRQVLMLGYMNAEALATTIKSGKVHFFSRSKQRLWKKGETSGNTFKLVNLAADCDSDALLVEVKPKGPACHTGTVSCFGMTRVRDWVSSLICAPSSASARKTRPRAPMLAA